MKITLDHYVGRKLISVRKGIITLEDGVEIHVDKTPKVDYKSLPLTFTTVVMDNQNTQMVFANIDENTNTITPNSEWRITIPFTETIKIVENGSEVVLGEDDSAVPLHPDEREATGPDSEYYESLISEEERIKNAMEQAEQVQLDENARIQEHYDEAMSLREADGDQG